MNTDYSRQTINAPAIPAQSQLADVDVSRKLYYHPQGLPLVTKLAKECPQLTRRQRRAMMRKALREATQGRKVARD